MSKSFLFAALVAASLCMVVSPLGDAAGTVARVGYLDPESRDVARWGWPAFWQRMRELGYIEGSNLIVEARFADGRIDRLPALISDLVKRRVDVIFTYSLPGALAAKNGTSTTPIVTVTPDPVGSGLVASLSRPGGNVTGLSTAWEEGRGGKWLELLQETVPNLSTVAVISNPEDALSALAAQQLRAAAATRGLKLRFIDVHDRTELDHALELARRHAEAVVVVPGAFTNTHRQKILGLTAKLRLPDLHGPPEDADLGALLAFGPDSSQAWRRAAEYVDKILRGAKPTDLPIEHVTQVSLSVNLKRAKELGISIPQSILVRADKVIR
jgi:putative ABC transport system substrate-binding protein